MSKALYVPQKVASECANALRQTKMGLFSQPSLREDMGLSLLPQTSVYLLSLSLSPGPIPNLLPSVSLLPVSVFNLKS